MKQNYEALEAGAIDVGACAKEIAKRINQMSEAYVKQVADQTGQKVQATLLNTEIYVAGVIRSHIKAQPKVGPVQNRTVEEIAEKVYQFYKPFVPTGWLPEKEELTTLLCPFIIDDSRIEAMAKEIAKQSVYSIDDKTGEEVCLFEEEEITAIIRSNLQEKGR